MSYCKRRETIDAIQWTGLNFQEVYKWLYGQDPLMVVHVNGKYSEQDTYLRIRTNGSKYILLTCGDYLYKGKEGLQTMSGSDFNEQYEFVGNEAGLRP